MGRNNQEYYPGCSSVVQSMHPDQEARFLISFLIPVMNNLKSSKFCQFSLQTFYKKAFPFFAFEAYIFFWFLSADRKA